MDAFHSGLRPGGDPPDPARLSSDPAEVFSPFAGSPGAVLLETQGPEARERYSFLFRDPVRTLVCHEPVRVPELLSEAENWQARGFAVAGYISYEAGFTLDPAFERELDDLPCPFPLIWFGVYEDCLRYDHLAGRWEPFGCAPGGRAGDVPGKISSRPHDEELTPRFTLSKKSHGEKVETIRARIAEGLVYQANLTGKFVFPFAGTPFELYLRLRTAQPVPFAAFLRTENGCIVSQSPELFFRTRGDRIETRPMKGTAPRGLTLAEDRMAAAALRNDPKNRAENVMIVDLLRNDLGRVCRPGTIRATRLFEVQRYRTVLQMVSTVSGRLLPGTSLSSIFRALFPCGSVTGAPKISAMRLLQQLEEDPRGIYTGAIGALLPDGDMAFSVAIRTIVIRNGIAEAGAGGGIVWDSRPDEEYREILQKGRYLTEPALDFRLIETLLWTPGDGFRFLRDHLRRMSASARYFGFRFRPESVRSALEHAVRRCPQTEEVPMKVRLLLEKNGGVSVETSPLPRRSSPEDRKCRRVVISASPIHSHNPFYRHKTTNRAGRDQELKKARETGYDEVIFLNERGEVTEGAISNLFAEISGVFHTPPPTCGLLEGVFRHQILKNRALRAREQLIFPEDLLKADRIFLTNSVRGMIEARICPEDFRTPSIHGRNPT